VVDERRCELSGVVPVFNEEESIAPLVNALTSVLRRTRRPFEIIFVDDGSTDNSAERLATAVATHPEIKIMECALEALGLFRLISLNLPTTSSTISWPMACRILMLYDAALHAGPPIRYMLCA